MPSGGLAPGFWEGEISRKVSPDPPFRHVSFRYANLHVPGWFAWGGMGTYFPLLKTRGKTQDRGGAGISNISRTLAPMGDADGEEAAGAPQGALCVSRLPNARRGGNKSP